MFNTVQCITELLLREVEFGQLLNYEINLPAGTEDKWATVAKWSIFFEKNVNHNRYKLYNPCYSDHLFQVLKSGMNN